VMVMNPSSSRPLLFAGPSRMDFEKSSLRPAKLWSMEARLMRRHPVLESLNTATVLSRALANPPPNGISMQTHPSRYIGLGWELVGS
jgi:hypothetical protein